MPQFYVTVEYPARETVMIEAENENDAWEQARRTDVFIEDVVSREVIGEVNILSVKEVK
jgi:hypothetical protein